MISFHGLLDVIAGDFSKLAKPRQGFTLQPPRIAVRRTRYSGEQLREIRAKKGVGRRRPPIAYGGEFMDGWKRYPAINASIFGWESPNYAEWQSKPRRKARGPAA